MTALFPCYNLGPGHINPHMTDERDDSLKKGENISLRVNATYLSG